MSKTTEKLGSPVLTIHGEIKKSMRVYSSNRQRRDPQYQADVLAHDMRKKRTQRFSNRRTARAGNGGGGNIQVVTELSKTAPQFSKY